MKKLPFAKLILPALILLFTACRKETGISEFSTQPGRPNTIAVGNQVAIKLFYLEGFSNPCFNMSLDAVFQESFRFSGYNLWNYSSLAPGLHSFSFTCLHECKDENGSEIMKFEIDDGKHHQEVSARETDHCKYEFWLNVN